MNREFKDKLVTVFHELYHISPAFNGDRILVNKYPYEIGEPERWDVFVFKYPEEPSINYIKRLVGLPNETLRIRQGNVYRWDPKREEEKILRKDPAKQMAIQIPVYDDRFPCHELLQAGWPERWSAEEKEGWQQNAEQRSFQSAKVAAERWIRYQHFPADKKAWDALENHQKITPPRPRLITDFCPYNAYSIWDEVNGAPRRMVGDPLDYGAFWVGDLTVDCDVTVENADPDSQLVLELCEGIRRFRCRWSPATGKIRIAQVTALDPEGRDELLGEAETSDRGNGEYHVTFANVDDRLCLWINQKLIPLGPKAEYVITDATMINLPQQSDLSPVGIATQNLAATVKNIVLFRDLYYRSDTTPGHPAYMNTVSLENDLTRLVESPKEWSDRYQRDAEQLNRLEFEIGPDHYLALGDNSPRSRDSRLWSYDSQTVSRNYLVGKAFWIYWPHGVPFLNDGKGITLMNHSVPYQNPETRQQESRSVEDYPRTTVPFYPNLPRMKRIH